MRTDCEDPELRVNFGEIEGFLRNVPEWNKGLMLAARTCPTLSEDGPEPTEEEEGMCFHMEEKQKDHLRNLGKAHEYRELVVTETARVVGSIALLSSSAGEINSDEAKAHYLQAETKVEAQRARLHRLQERIDEAIGSMQEAQAYAAAKRFPGRAPKEPPFRPGLPPGIVIMPTPTVVPDRGGIGDLIDMDRGRQAGGVGGAPPPPGFPIL